MDLQEIQPRSENHALSRIRSFKVTSLNDVYAMLNLMRQEKFCGKVQVNMTEGGFNDLTTEENIRLVLSETNS